MDVTRVQWLPGDTANVVEFELCSLLAGPAPVGHEAEPTGYGSRALSRWLAWGVVAAPEKIERPSGDGAEADE